jgi:P-type Cu2+ transporter
MDPGGRHHHHHEEDSEQPAKPGYPKHPEEGSHAGHEAHDKHAGHSVEMFRIKFWVALALTLPAVLWGHMLPHLLGYEPPAFPGSEWIAPLFGTIVFFYGGWVFLLGAWQELKDRLPGMMTLISLAITVAFGFSVAVLLGFPGMPLWEEVATLITVMLLGHWIEMKSIMQAQGAVQELAKLLTMTTCPQTSKRKVLAALALTVAGLTVPGAVPNPRSARITRR